MRAFLFHAWLQIFPSRGTNIVDTNSSENSAPAFFLPSPLSLSLSLPRFFALSCLAPSISPSALLRNTASVSADMGRMSKSFVPPPPPLRCLPFPSPCCCVSLSPPLPRFFAGRLNFTSAYPREGRSQMEVTCTVSLKSSREIHRALVVSRFSASRRGNFQRNLSREGSARKKEMRMQMREQLISNGQLDTDGDKCISGCIIVARGCIPGKLAGDISPARISPSSRDTG